MEFTIFSEELKRKAKQMGVSLKEEQIQKFYQYMNLLLEWNEKMNLTAIIEPKEILLKHFVDSLIIANYIEEGQSLIDVGTGAGFPGIPLAIVKEEVEITLLDSLNKRIRFLQEVIEVLQLKNIRAVHARVEEFAKNKKEREQYDIATSRAVAPLNVLSEYLLPLVKIGGKCICMKGSNIEEIKEAEKAVTVLGGEIKKVEEITLPESDMKRHIITLNKVKGTPSKYPRKPGTPSKEPI